MEFNRFLWENFKESAYGKEMLDFFSNYKEALIRENNDRYYRKMIKEITDTGDFEENLSNYIREISKIYNAFTHDDDNYEININIQSLDDAENYFRELFDIQNEDENGKPIGKLLSSSDIPILSEVLFAISPEYFFPYYFDRSYQDVVMIFNTFGIFLPALPGKNDETGRFFHYFELCKSLYQFRSQNGLSGYELPAFLYGFAFNIIKRYKVSNELPEPRKAFFVGGGINNNGDFDYLDKVTQDSVVNWNGNPETQTGDIIVMYCLAPRSYVHSIWRAVTPGSIDPFFYYYKNINIGYPILIKPISLDEMKKDTVLNELPLLRANMQGINGREIPKKYYDRLLELLERKGQDMMILPVLRENEIEMPALKNEKDVEEKLLEPLLQKIGYRETDWRRQMKLRMGRGDKIYPDYAIFPHEERNNESCYWVWEAKYSINSHKQLEEDFGQAKSYALRLRSSGLGLVSKEGVWLCVPDFFFGKIRFWSWKQIADHDSLNEIFTIAGNKKREVS